MQPSVPSQDVDKVLFVPSLDHRTPMATSPFCESLTAIVCITIRLMSARTTELINLLKVRGNFHISLKHPLQRYTHILVLSFFLLSIQKQIILIFL